MREKGEKLYESWPPDTTPDPASYVIEAHHSHFRTGRFTLYYGVVPGVDGKPRLTVISTARRDGSIAVLCDMLESLPIPPTPESPQINKIFWAFNDVDGLRFSICVRVGEVGKRYTSPYIRGFKSTAFSRWKIQQQKKIARERAIEILGKTRVGREVGYLDEKSRYGYSWRVERIEHYLMHLVDDPSDYTFPKYLFKAEAVRRRLVHYPGGKKHRLDSVKITDRGRALLAEYEAQQTAAEEIADIAAA
jgi:hypothetical protein